MNSIVEPYDIYIVGLGMVGYRQLTIEGDEALRRCHSVFVINANRFVIEHLQERYKQVIDLTANYEKGRLRKKIYAEMADVVIEAGRARPPVGFAPYGHPYVYVTPTTLITDGATQANLRVKNLPGISSLDCLLIDLQLEPATHGLQMYEATDLIVYGRPIQPDVPCLVWQIGAVGRLTHDTAPVDLADYQAMRDHLLQFYNGDHTVVLARTATLPFTRSRLRSVPLSQFLTVVDNITGADTLYIPPAQKRRVNNRTYLERISSRSTPERPPAHSTSSDE